MRETTTVSHPSMGAKPPRSCATYDTLGNPLGIVHDPALVDVGDALLHRRSAAPPVRGIALERIAHVLETSFGTGYELLCSGVHFAMLACCWFSVGMWNISRDLRE